MNAIPCLEFAVFVQPLPLIFRRGPRVMDLDRAICWRATQLMGSKWEGVHSAVAANLDPMIPGSGNRARRRVEAIDAEAKRRELADWYDRKTATGGYSGD
jgi:hypothetical protein